MAALGYYKSLSQDTDNAIVETKKLEDEATKLGKIFEKQLKDSEAEATKLGKLLEKSIIEEMNKAKENAKKFKESLEAIGQVGKAVFAGLTASVAGFGAVASPRDWAELEGAFGALSVEIGRIFIPIIREVTDWVKGLVHWFEDLTDETRETIVTWVKWGIVISAVVVGFIKLLSVVKNVYSAWQTIGTAGVAACGALAASIAAIIYLLQVWYERQAQIKKLNEDIGNTKVRETENAAISPEETAKYKRAVEEYKRTLSKEDLGKFNAGSDEEKTFAIAKHFENKRDFEFGKQESLRVGPFTGSRAAKQSAEAEDIFGVTKRFLDQQRQGHKIDWSQFGGPQGNGKFDPSIIGKAPTLTNLTDVWQKAQTAVQTTTEMSVAQQQLKQQEITNQKLDDLISKRPVIINGG